MATAPANLDLPFQPSDPFVGRDEELRTLIDCLQSAGQGIGSTVFIEAGVGMGKSKLITTLEEHLRLRSEFAKTIFSYGYCCQDTGTHNAYQPLVEILQNFSQLTPSLATVPQFQQTLSKRITKIIRTTAPDWLQMIPGIGPLISAGMLTAKIAMPLMGKNVEHNALPETIATQYTNAIQQIAKEHKPIVMVIEDAHWIDRASAQVLIRLAQTIAQMPTVLLISYRPEALEATHPLTQLRAEVRARNNWKRLSLQSFSEESITQYLRTRYGHSLEPNLARWLHQLCHGHPLFVTQYLKLLEEQDIIYCEGDRFLFRGTIAEELGQLDLRGEIAEIRIPDSVEAVLEQRIERLPATEQELLELGSVQGECFFSSVLARIVGQQELQVLARLRKIADQHHVISFHPADEWLKQRAEVFAFEHLVLQQALYRRLGRRERELHHHAVAKLFEALVEGVHPAPRKMLLETGRHFAQAGCLSAAAHWYSLAAQSSFRDGAFVETAKLCREVLHWLGNATDPGESRLRVSTICLLLLALEFSWSGKRELQGELPVNDLVDEAELLATELNDQELLTQVKYIKARLLASTTGLRESIETFQEALQLASDSGDETAEFMVRCDFGHQLVGENINAGLSMMYQAKSLFESRLQSRSSGDSRRMLQRHYFRLQTTLGVNEFDRGDFDQALVHLQAGIDGLRELEMRDDLSRAFNFLGQVYTSMGQFEEAERAIYNGIEQLTERKGPNPWRAYNLGLLGKLYLEWERYEDADEALVAAWDETKRTWNADLAPLVSNYRAELLIHPSFQGRSLSDARMLLEQTIVETTKTRFHRSQIAAQSLLGQLLIAEGNTSQALAVSEQAIHTLQAAFHGKLPALRTEEVFFLHGEILVRVNLDEDARMYFDKAKGIVSEKASSMKNASDREIFLQRIPINRRILAVNS